MCILNQRLGVLNDPLRHDKKMDNDKKIKDASKGPKSVAQNWRFLSFSKIFKREDFVVRTLP